MTKNLFLYINANKDLTICHKCEDIYCIGDKLVAVDKNKYDRKNRFALQKQFDVYPYFISQYVFKDILRSLAYGKINIFVVNIDFTDDSIIETQEYNDLQLDIKKMDKKNLYNDVLNIINEFDTEIKNIKFIYNGKVIELTNKGILNFQSKDEMLHDFTSSEDVVKLLLGKI